MSPEAKKLHGKLKLSNIRMQTKEAPRKLGPEDEDHLADSDYCDQGLSELFADFGNKIDIGASENQHVVILIPGVKASDLWSVIRERLIRSGAMPGKL